MTTRLSKTHLSSCCECCNSSSTRRSFLAGAAAFGAASGSGFSASITTATAQSAGTPPRDGEYVIRGGYVITMDRTGDIPVGDIHVRNGAIVAVAPSISAPGAEVVDAQN